MNSLTLPRWFGRKKRSKEAKEATEAAHRRQSVILSENVYENLHLPDLDVNEAIRGFRGHRGHDIIDGAEAETEAEVQYRFYSTPLGHSSPLSHSSNSRPRPFSFDEGQGQIWLLQGEWANIWVVKKTLS